MQTGLTGHSTPSVTAGRSVAGHPFSSIPDRDEDRYQRRSQSLFGTSLRLGRGMPCPDTRVLRCVVAVVAPPKPKPAMIVFQIRITSTGMQHGLTLLHDLRIEAARCL